MHDILTSSNEYRAFEVKDVVLYPPAWSALSLPSSLTWVSHRFSMTRPRDIPDDERGVYTFVVQPSIADHPLCSFLLYVGKAAGQEGFRTRYQSYRGEHGKPSSDRPLVHRMINSWYDHLWFCRAVVADGDIERTENELLKAYLPAFNTSYPAEISAPMRAF